ncbi:MAG: hypothetical protein R3C99_24470 [Pirellulaceae bacterium]
MTTRHVMQACHAIRIRSRALGGTTHGLLFERNGGSVLKIQINGCCRSKPGDLIADP